VLEAPLPAAGEAGSGFDATREELDVPSFLRD